LPQNVCLFQENPSASALLDLPLTKSLRGESFTSHRSCGQQAFITLVRFRQGHAASKTLQTAGHSWTPFV
jgi:hypothetical protein